MNRRRWLLSIFPGLVVASTAAAATRDPKPVVRDPKPAAPRQPAPVSALGNYDPDHRCDKCGYESPKGEGTWIQRSDHGNYHTHQCPQCHSVWWHYEPGQAPQPAYSINPFAAPGCASGNCPTTSRGFIRRR